MGTEEESVISLLHGSLVEEARYQFSLYFETGPGAKNNILELTLVAEKGACHTASCFWTVRWENWLPTSRVPSPVLAMNRRQKGESANVCLWKGGSMHVKCSCGLKEQGHVGSP